MLCFANFLTILLVGPNVRLCYLKMESDITEVASCIIWLLLSKAFLLQSTLLW